MIGRAYDFAMASRLRSTRFQSINASSSSHGSVNGVNSLLLASHRSLRQRPGLGGAPHEVPRHECSLRLSHDALLLLNTHQEPKIETPPRHQAAEIRCRFSCGITPPHRPVRPSTSPLQKAGCCPAMLGLLMLIASIAIHPLAG